MGEPIGLPPPGVTPPDWQTGGDVESKKDTTSPSRVRQVGEQQGSTISSTGKKSKYTPGTFSFDDTEIEVRLATNNASYESLHTHPGVGLDVIPPAQGGDSVLGKSGAGNKWFNVSALAILSYYLLMIQDAFMKAQAMDNEYVASTIGMFSEIAKDVKKLDEYAADKAYMKEFASAMGQFAAGAVAVGTIGISTAATVRSKQQINANIDQNKQDINVGSFTDASGKQQKVDLSNGDLIDPTTNKPTGTTIDPADRNQLNDNQLIELQKNGGPAQQRLAQSHLHKRNLESTPPDPNHPNYTQNKSEYQRDINKADHEISQAKDNIKQKQSDITTNERFGLSTAFGQSYQKTLVWTEGVAKALSSGSQGAAQLWSAEEGRLSDIARAESKYKETGEQLVSKWMDRSTEERKKSHDNINSLLEFMMQMQNEMAKLGIGYNR